MNFRTILNILLTGLATYTAAVGAGLDSKSAAIATGAALVSNLFGLSQEQTAVIGNFISIFKKK